MSELKVRDQNWKILRDHAPVQFLELVMGNRQSPYADELHRMIADGRLTLSLPEDAEIVESVRQDIGIDPKISRPPAGIYTLGVLDCPISGATPWVGIPLRVCFSLIDQSGNQPVRQAIQRATHASMKWIFDRFGLVKLHLTGTVNLLDFNFRSDDRLDDCPLLTGDSIALAAALSFTSHVLGDSPTTKGRIIALSGAVKWDGTVHPVGRLREKIVGLCKELPHFDLLVIPSEQLDIAREVIANPGRIIAINNTDNLFDILFDTTDNLGLITYDLLQASYDAMTCESRCDHNKAVLIAKKINDAIKADNESRIPQQQKLTSKVRADIILAIKDIHDGKTKEGLAALATLGQLITRINEDDEGSINLPLDTRAAIGISRASGLIDMLDFTAAEAELKKFRQNLKDFENYRYRNTWHGTMVRVLCAQGRYREALECAGKQEEIV